MDNDLDLLEALYADMGSGLIAYFRGHAGLAGAAEDLLQETFARAMRNLGRLSRSSSPRAYLFGIARHVALDALRRLKPMEPLPDNAPSPCGVEDARLELMRAALGELPSQHREVMDLKLRHELSYSEIAEVLGIPIGTVRSRIHYAVERLQKSLRPSQPMNSHHLSDNEP